MGFFMDLANGMFDGIDVRLSGMVCTAVYKK